MCSICEDPDVAISGVKMADGSIGKLCKVCKKLIDRDVDRLYGSLEKRGPYVVRNIDGKPTAELKGGDE